MSSFKIKTIKAFIVEEFGGNERILASELNGALVPFISDDDLGIEKLRPLAKRIAQEDGLNIKLVEFSAREVLEEIVPKH